MRLKADVLSEYERVSTLVLVRYITLIIIISGHYQCIIIIISQSTLVLTTTMSHVSLHQVLTFKLTNCVSTLVLATGLIVLRKNRLYNTISDLSLKLYDISLQTNKLDQNKDSQQGADYSSRGE